MLGGRRRTGEVSAESQGMTVRFSRSLTHPGCAIPQPSGGLVINHKKDVCDAAPILRKSKSMVFGWVFPWALPRATLCMAVGQVWNSRVARRVAQVMTSREGEATTETIRENSANFSGNANCRCVRDFKLIRKQLGQTPRQLNFP